MSVFQSDFSVVRRGKQGGTAVGGVGCELSTFCRTFANPLVRR